MSQSPTPRGPGRPAANRERSRSMLSFSSGHSDKSASKQKSSKLAVDLKGYKERKRTFSDSKSSNPSMAMSEDQPFVRAEMEKQTLAPIRAMQHRDLSGNVITDADRSNPTRHRMERPLDTIRSFEAAIEESYKRRVPLPRTESDNAMSGYSSRRSSMIGSERQSSRFEHHRNGPSYRSSSYQDGGHYNPSSHMRPPNPRYMSAPLGRMGNDNSNYNTYNNHSYANPRYDEYYDTAGAESSGSHSTEQWGTQTEPSSENSSVERMQPPDRFDGPPQSYSQYGRSSPLQRPKPFVIEEEAYGVPGTANGFGDSMMGSMPPPPPPTHAGRFAGSMPAGMPSSQPIRAPIQLGGTPGLDHSKMAPIRPALETRDGGKRKSWLKRTFSKGG